MERLESLLRDLRREREIVMRRGVHEAASEFEVEVLRVSRRERVRLLSEAIVKLETELWLRETRGYCA